jgi:hypothetical protein
MRWRGRADARRHSPTPTRRILKAAERPGEVGALMRREAFTRPRVEHLAAPQVIWPPWHHKSVSPKIASHNRAETLQIAQLTRERDGLQRESTRRCWYRGPKKLATLLTRKSTRSHDIAVHEPVLAAQLPALPWPLAVAPARQRAQASAHRHGVWLSACARPAQISALDDAPIMLDTLNSERFAGHGAGERACHVAR